MKKLFIILILLTLFATGNLGFLTIKNADAVAAPVAVVTDIPRDTMDRIGVAVWKAAVYPLIRDMVISVATTGDFKISWGSIKSWLIHDLAFQTANAFLNEYIGFDLCTTISGNVIIALGQMYGDSGFSPDCTFDQSVLAKTTEKLFTGDSKEAWQDVKNYYYANFHLSLLGESNQFGTWFKLQDNIDNQINQRQQNIKFEMLINEGFLGQYDCSGVPENRRPDDCRVLSPGMAVAELIKGSYRDPMNSALQAQMITDLASLSGIVVDILKNKFIYAAYDKL